MVRFTPSSFIKVDGVISNQDQCDRGETFSRTSAPLLRALGILFLASFSLSLTHTHTPTLSLSLSLTLPLFSFNSETIFLHGYVSTAGLEYSMA